MKTSEFKQHLEQHPHNKLSFVLPGGRTITAHAHITEVGRVDKTFLDCGEKVRRVSIRSLQAWVTNDAEHRLTAGKLAGILNGAASMLGDDDLPVEIEFQEDLISQFPVEDAKAANGVLSFQLGIKYTDCLAKDVCLPKTEDAECCNDTSCC
jgi:hypothetical protein